MKARYVPLIALLSTTCLVRGQMTVDNTITPEQLVQSVLLGQGVSASNVTFNGAPGNVASPQAGKFVSPGSDLGLDGGVVMACGDVMSDPGTFTIGANGNVSDFAANGMGTGQSDPDLAVLANQTINDAAILEFDFIPTGDSLKFRYVFGSEEYPGYTCTVFNDAFGFFLSGPGINGPFTNNAINIALVPGTNIPVSINTVNSGSPSGGSSTLCDQADPNWQANSIYFVDNAGLNGVTVTYDGMTVVLTAFALVECGVEYHIKLAIGDGTDSGILDSGVFLEGGSFTSTASVIPELSLENNVSANDTMMFEGCGIVPFLFHRIGDTSVVDTINILIGGTATGGIDYYPPFPIQLIYQAGDTMVPWPVNIPLDPDGVETIEMTISQNIVCSGTQVVDEYTFYIGQYAPLDVQTTDVNGDCGGIYELSPIVTGGTGLYQFEWNTGATTPSITVNPALTTLYTFTIYDTCGVVPWTDSVLVTMPVYPPLEMTVTPDTLIDCLGNGDIQVTSVGGGNGEYNYGWTLNGAAAGNTALINVPAASPAVYYVATVTDGCGITMSDSVQVGTVPLDPIVILSPDRTVICQGDTTTLMVVEVTGGNGVYSYEWTNAQEQTLSLADTLQVGVPFDAVYTITIEDECGTVGSETVYSLVPNPAPFLLDLTGDTTLCLGDSLTLWAQVSGGSGYYTVEWPGQEWSDPQLPVSPPVNETYTVLIHDQCGETIGDEVHVGVELPVVDIVATNMGEDDWKFEAATEPTFCRNYRWDLGDGTTSRESMVMHSYLDLEEYWVHLKVVTYNGCDGKDSLLIRPPGHLYFPNAFTPDGDGINEMFGPVSSYIEEFEMLIFDRWGQQIYATESLNKPWDGKVNGAEAPTGVYVYKFKATGHLFPAMEDFGHVTLLRGSIEDE